MENNGPKAYSLRWFCEELVKGVFIAIALFVLQIVGTGILMAYTLPDRLDREAEKMQKKFDVEIQAERAAAVKREAELLENMETQKKQYSEAILELKRIQGQQPPPSGPGPGFPPMPVPNAQQVPDWKNIGEQRAIDPEKKRLEWLQKHGK